MHTCACDAPTHYLECKSSLRQTRGLRHPAVDPTIPFTSRSEYSVETIGAETVRHLVTTEELGVRFLTGLSRTVKRARRQVNLSLQQVASRAGVPPNLVERLESGDVAACTLGQFIDIILACDHIPHDLTMAPTDAMRRFVRDVPPGAATAAAYDAWEARMALRGALRSAKTARHAEVSRR